MFDVNLHLMFQFTCHGCEIHEKNLLFSNSILNLFGSETVMHVSEQALRNFLEIELPMYLVSYMDKLDRNCVKMRRHYVCICACSGSRDG